MNPSFCLGLSTLVGFSDSCLVIMQQHFFPLCSPFSTFHSCSTRQLSTLFWSLSQSCANGHIIRSYFVPVCATTCIWGGLCRLDSIYSIIIPPSETEHIRLVEYEHHSRGTRSSSHVVSSSCSFPLSSHQSLHCLVYAAQRQRWVWWCVISLSLFFFVLSLWACMYAPSPPAV